MCIELIPPPTILEKDISVLITTVDGTAMGQCICNELAVLKLLYAGGVDYEPLNETLTFNSDSSPTMCVNITFIPDEVTEDTEVFDVIASSLFSSVSFVLNQTSVSVLDNNSKNINFFLQVCN